MTDPLTVNDLLSLIPDFNDSIVINGMKITNKGTFVWNEASDDE